MKEHPIIFSTESVHAILEGRKTQTRRVIKPQPIQSVTVIKQHSCFPDLWVPYTNDGRMVNNNLGSHKNDCEYFCPYGQVGDKLWARETHYRYGRWIKNGFTKTGKQKWTFKGVPELITLNTIRGEESLRYINNPPDNVKPNSYRKEAWYKRASLFMPRWASRINLEITGLRVERLQEISVDDIKAEGIKFLELVARYASIRDYRGEFQELWDSINAKQGYGWETNPWVWVIEFKITEER